MIGVWKIHLENIYTISLNKDLASQAKCIWRCGKTEAGVKSDLCIISGVEAELQKSFKLAEGPHRGPWGLHGSIRWKTGCC